MKKNVAVIMGGMGAEKEVSLRTGAAFVKSLERLKYPFSSVLAGPDLPQVLSQLKCDVALIALHGKYGEDGTVQGLLEYLRIPYTGSGVMSSALAMNKVVTKQILSHYNIPTAEWQVIDLTKIKILEAKLTVPLPVVVKPAREGSTVGLSIVHKKEDFHKALELAFTSDTLIIVEKFIDGVEVTVPIWGDQVLPIIEIVPKTGFYDYKSKYTVGATEYIMPARISQKVKEACEKYAIETFNAVNCRQYARVDLRIDQNEKPWVLEINTLPGCTETSLFPKAAAKAGIAFDQFVETLVEGATLDYR